MIPPTSLYRCEKCGDVVRYWAGQIGFGHIHEDADGTYLGKGAEGRYVEFPDDGRDVGDNDMTDEANGVWLA